MNGHILVVTGGMYSGKSEQLIDRVKKLKEYGNKKVKMYKPSCDDRFSEEEVVSRMGYRFPATNIPTQITEDVMNQILLETKEIEVVGFDETQFYSRNIMKLISELAYRGKYVIVAGLNMNFKGEEFGYMGGILAQADEVVRLYSFCKVCGSDKGTHTQRLMNGKPAKNDSPEVLIGDSESYEPRCRSCFVPPEKA